MHNSRPAPRPRGLFVSVKSRNAPDAFLLCQPFRNRDHNSALFSHCNPDIKAEMEHLTATKLKSRDLHRKPLGLDNRLHLDFDEAVGMAQAADLDEGTRGRRRSEIVVPHSGAAVVLFDIHGIGDGFYDVAEGGSDILQTGFDVLADLANLGRHISLTHNLSGGRIAGHLARKIDVGVVGASGNGNGGVKVVPTDDTLPHRIRLEECFFEHSEPLF
jgi:hypothetical protein